MATNPRASKRSSISCACSRHNPSSSAPTASTSIRCATRPATKTAPGTRAAAWISTANSGAARWNRKSAIIERELLVNKFDGIISLHSDDTSEGLYGFVRGHTLTQHLLTPALAAAEAALPVNQSRR